jgi:hypothetical protein
VKFVDTKNIRHLVFSPCLFRCFGIRDGKKSGSRSGIRNKHPGSAILLEFTGYFFYLGLHCAEEPAKAQAPLSSESATENLDDLIQMSADLELADRPLPAPAALGGGPDAAWRPRHTSSSSDISSEGNSEGLTVKSS